VFKTAQNDSAVLQNIIDYAAANGWTTIGLLRDASGFGEGIAETLAELGEPEGISVGAGGTPATDAAGLSAQELNLRAAGDRSGHQDFLDTAGEAADGVVAPLGRLLVADQLPDSDPQKEVLARFLADYEERYGETPSTFAGHAWDAFQLAIDAFEAVGTDKQAVRDYLERVSGFVGI